MKLQFKKLSDAAVTPTYAKPGDAGADLTATSIDFSRDGQVVYGTGIAVEIPELYVGLVFPRSSIRNKDLRLTNCVGVIDSGYRGEIMATFELSDGVIRTDEVAHAHVEKLGSSGEYWNIYNIGDRIAQLVIVPIWQVDFTEVKELSDSERGTGGHGSTGLN